MKDEINQDLLFQIKTDEFSDSSSKKSHINKESENLDLKLTNHTTNNEQKENTNFLFRVNSNLSEQHFDNVSLFIFKSDNPFRLKLQYIVSLKLFSAAIIVLIILNSVFLIFETIPKLERLGKISDYIFTILFTIEFLMKIIVYGFVLDDNSYLRDPWNWLDFIVIITGLMSFFPTINANLFSLRTFRLLRPLKSINKLPNMKIFIITLINSLGDLGNIFFLTIFIFIIFGVTGLSIWSERQHYRCRISTEIINGTLPLNLTFKGSLCGGKNNCGNNKHLCIDSMKYYLDKKITNKSLIDAENNYYSVNYGVNSYNNIISSVFTNIYTYTGEGWANVMLQFMDGYQYYLSFLYFFFSLIINYFFMLNLTIAMLLYNFEKTRNFNIQRDNYLNRILNENNGEQNKSEKKIIGKQIINSLNAHNNTIEVTKRLYRLKYIPLRMRKVEKKKRRRFKKCKFPKLFQQFPIKTIYHRKYKIAFVCYFIYHQPITQMFFYICILLYAIILTLDRVNIPKKESRFIDLTNFILVLIFSLENLLHIIGAGIKEFSKSYFNVFDCVIVYISLINSITKEVRNKDVSENVTTILRMFRILRMFKLFEKRQFFRVILESIRISVFRMVDYILVFLIFLYMFTLLGYSLFHLGLKDNAYNYRTFISSLISTFRIIIGDRWQIIFYSCFNEKNISNFAIYIYFISIMFFGHIVLNNIFLAYLVENFIKTKRILEKNVNVKNFMLNLCYQVSDFHYFQIKEITNNKKKKKEIDSSIKSLDKVLQKMNNKKLLLEEEFKFIVRIKIDFTQFKAFIVHNEENVEDKEEEMDNKSNNQLNDFFNTEYKLEQNTNIKVKVFENNTLKAKNPILDKIDILEQFLDNVPFYKFKIKYWQPYKSNEKLIDQSTLLFQKSLEEQTTIKPRSASKSMKNVKKRGKKRFSLFVNTPKSNRNLNNKLELNSKINNNNSNNNINANLINSNPVKKDYNNPDNFEINDEELLKRITDSYSSNENNTSSNEEDYISSDNETDNKISDNISNIKSSENSNKNNENNDIKKIGTSAPLKRRPSLVFNEKEKNMLQLEALKNLSSQEHKLPTQSNSSNNENESENSSRIITPKKKNLKINMSYKIWFYMKNSSLFIFHKDLTIRKLIKKLVYHRFFNFVILLLIILNCIEMCLDNNWIDPDSKKKSAINIINKFFNITFLIECLLKIIANDFIWKDPEDLNSMNNIKKIIAEYENLDKENNFENSSDSEENKENKVNKEKTIISLHPINDPLEKRKVKEKAKKILLNHPAYLRDSSNVIDFICVCFGTADLFVSRDLSYFKTLRAFRAIKPIRLLAKSDNLNLMIKCLFKSLPSIGSVMLVAGLIVFLFCLLGVNLFKKKLGYFCDNFNYSNQKDCEENGFIWFKNPFNFDNFLYSFSTNFQVIMSENWGDLMVISQSKYKSRWIYWYYFVIVILGNMIMLNLLVGVLIEQFKSIKEEETNYFLLTEGEIEWIHVQKVMLKQKPYIFIPEEKYVSQFKALCIKIISSKWFDNYIIVSIISSFLILTLQYAYAPKGYKTFLDTLNYIFTTLFNVEIFLKIYVQKNAFFYLNWNIFDFVILCLCDIMVIIKIAVEIGGISKIFLVVRCFRTLKLIRKIPYLSKIKSIIDSLSYLASSLFSVAIIMFLIIMIYANVGMSFFGNLPYRQFINDKLNFRNFITSSILLFEITTKEEWSNFMYESAYHDCKNPKSQTYKEDYYCYYYNITCYPESQVTYKSMKENNMFSCGNNLSYFYFISFMIIGPLFIMNLCIVMVIEGFNEAVSDNEGLLTVDYLEQFIKVWKKYDYQCTNLIKPYEFVLMFKELQPPIGINYDRLIWRINYNREDERCNLLSHRNFINLIHEKNLEANDFEHLCNETKNAYEFKEYYISKDLKFDTNDSEVMILTNKLLINPSELNENNKLNEKYEKKIKILTNVNNKDNIFNDSNSEDSKVNELGNKVKEKFKDLYVHYIEACLVLSRFAVSTMCNCTFESLRYNLVNSYTKKLWINEFGNDKHYVSNSYLDNKKNNEEIKLSEYLASKILYMKLLKRKIIDVRKKIIEKQEGEEQKNLIKEMGTFKIEKEKSTATIKNYFNIINKMKENKKLGVIGKQIHFGRFNQNPVNPSEKHSLVSRGKRISFFAQDTKKIKDLHNSNFYKNDDLKNN